MFPGLSESELNIAFENVVAWKEVHASVEELYYRYLLFEHQIIRCHEIIKFGDYELQQHYVYLAQNYLSELRKGINDFLNELQTLPSAVRHTRLIALLGNLSTFYMAIKRGLGSIVQDQQEAETIKDLTLRITDLLLHTLHIADQVLKKYFSEHK